MSKMSYLLFLLILVFAISAFSQENKNSYVEYLPDNLFDGVALIENGEYIETRNGDSLIYRPASSSILIYSNESHYILTAGHVTKRKDNLTLRLSRKGTSYKRISLDSLIKENNIAWVYDKDHDLCALKFDPSILKSVREKPFNINDLSADPKEFMLGTGIFIVGYPASVSQIDYHVVRKGAISAFISADSFLIDCFVFPGNSGGPVFLSAVPDIIAATKYSGLEFEMTIPGRESKFLGMVIDYLPYSELAISQQTHKPRIRFEENSGLSVALSAPIILNFVKKLE